MMHYIKKYPFSLGFILVVIYLSFFRPPSIPEVGRIPHFDKIVHVGMYFVMSSLLWWEFLRSHRDNGRKLWHAWIGAFLCPILFSGLIELMQQYCTDYRGGDWLDFLANTTGVIIASYIAYCFVRPRMWSRCV